MTSSLAPQPGIAELEQLAESVRAAGVPVELELDGELRPLPPAVELAAYRIVQEALTNMLKHAGPAQATVRVCLDGEALCRRGERRRRRSRDGRDERRRSRPTRHEGTRSALRRQPRAGTLPGGGFLVRARLPTGAA